MFSHSSSDPHRSKASYSYEPKASTGRGYSKFLDALAPASIWPQSTSSEAFSKSQHKHRRYRQGRYHIASRTYDEGREQKQVEEGEFRESGIDSTNQRIDLDLERFITAGRQSGVLYYDLAREWHCQGWSNRTIETALEDISLVTKEIIKMRRVQYCNSGFGSVVETWYLQKLHPRNSDFDQLGSGLGPILLRQEGRLASFTLLDVKGRRSAVFRLCVEQCSKDGDAKPCSNEILDERRAQCRVASPVKVLQYLIKEQELDEQELRREPLPFYISLWSLPAQLRINEDYELRTVMILPLSYQRIPSPLIPPHIQRNLGNDAVLCSLSDCHIRRAKNKSGVQTHRHQSSKDTIKDARRCDMKKSIPLVVNELERSSNWEGSDSLLGRNALATWCKGSGKSKEWRNCAAMRMKRHKW